LGLPKYGLDIQNFSFNNHQQRFRADSWKIPHLPKAAALAVMPL
jgi:hypothetical protein